MRKLLILLLSAISLTAVAQQKKVAVYVTGEQSGITKVLGDQLVAAFAKSGKYAAVERTNSFLAELSKEQSYQRSGAVSDNDIAHLGVQFGVNYVCVADMSDVFGEKYISARLIDVETAVIANAHNVTGTMESMEDCLKMAGEICAFLSQRTFKEQQVFENKIKQLEQEGYVNLGLPSETLWKNSNEAGYYRYDAAVDIFGSKLPTQKQFKELMDFCKWIWVGNGMKVIGPNGNFIVLHTSDWYNCDGEYIDRPYRDMPNVSWGHLWYSNPVDPQVVCFFFSDGVKCITNSERCNSFPVRLIKNL